jgi:hypothetical protein
MSMKNGKGQLVITFVVPCYHKRMAARFANYAANTLSLFKFAITPVRPYSGFRQGWMEAEYQPEVKCKAAYDNTPYEPKHFA